MLTNCFQMFVDSGLSAPSVMDLKLIHRLEIAVFCRPEDGVFDVPPDDLGNPLCDPLLDAYYIKAEDVLPIGFVLRVAVVHNLWLNGAFVGSGALGGRYRRRKNVSLLDVNGRLVFIERVADVARKSLNFVVGVLV